MKPQSRPFVVEVKKRRSPTSAKATPTLHTEFEERAWPTASNRLDGPKALSYEEALHAADHVFGGRLAHPKAPSPRPVDDARERLFRRATAAIEAAPAPQQRRILPSLVEVQTPALSAPEPAPRPRGRTRQPRPQPKAEMPVNDVPVGVAAPSSPPEQAPALVKRSAVKQSPASRLLLPEEADVQVPVVPSPGPEPAPAGAPRSRQANGFAPGERWKRRLRHLR
jgi:hypothetical protein